MAIRLPSRKIKVMYKPPEVTEEEIAQIKGWYAQYGVPLIQMIEKTQRKRDVKKQPRLSFVDLYSILYTLLLNKQLVQRTTNLNELTLEDFARFFNAWKRGATEVECIQAIQGRAVAGKQQKNLEFCRSLFRTMGERWRAEKKAQRVGEVDPSAKQLLEMDATTAAKLRTADSLFQLFFCCTVTIHHPGMTREQYPTDRGLFLPLHAISQELMAELTRYFPDLALLMNPGMKTGAEVEQLLNPPEDDDHLRPPDLLHRPLDEEETEMDILDPDGSIRAEAEKAQRDAAYEKEKQKMAALLSTGKLPTQATPAPPPPDNIDDWDLETLLGEEINTLTEHDTEGDPE